MLARFRNDAGLIGAADLARHAMIEPPSPHSLASGRAAASGE